MKYLRFGRGKKLENTLLFRYRLGVTARCEPESRNEGKKKSQFELLQHRVPRLDTASTPTQRCMHGRVLGPWLVTATPGPLKGTNYRLDRALDPSSNCANNAGRKLTSPASTFGKSNNLISLHFQTHINLRRLLHDVHFLLGLCYAVCLPSTVEGSLCSLGWENCTFYYKLRPSRYQQKRVKKGENFTQSMTGPFTQPAFVMASFPV